MFWNNKEYKQQAIIRLMLTKTRAEIRIMPIRMKNPPLAYVVYGVHEEGSGVVVRLYEVLFAVPDKKKFRGRRIYHVARTRSLVAGISTDTGEYLESAQASNEAGIAKRTGLEYEANMMIGMETVKILVQNMAVEHAGDIGERIYRGKRFEIIEDMD